MGNPLIDLLLAIFALAGAIGVIGMLRGSLYDRIGESSTSVGEPPHPGSSAAAAERDLEIRQMLQARNERLQRKGEAPLNLDAELAMLTSATGGNPDTEPAEVAVRPTRHDPELVEELRQLANARNVHRVRRGEEPLDVRAEVERALAELDG